MSKYITGFFMAWGCFTAIPCPYKKWDENARNQMLFALPFIGLLVGICWYALYLLLWKCFALPRLITAVLLAFFPMLLTGFIHIDGYMDCCDAIGSRRPREDKLRILKDSHVGAFACIGLIFWALINVAGVEAGLDNQKLIPCLIMIPALSRFMSAISVWGYAPLETSQYNRTESKKNLTVPLTIVMIALILAFFALFDIDGIVKIWSWTELVFAIEMIVYFIACKHARSQLGGMSGDISGYSITIAETAALLAIALLG